MVKLVDEEIQTREVLGWTGLHMFHAAGSSCSQKVRIFLNLKGVSWVSHFIDVLNNENLSGYYLGINPRGLIPALVHDGAVHIESNDILLHLEHCFPEPALIPPGREDEIAAMLKHEDELHMALRTLTFAFMISLSKPLKTADELVAYERGGSRTVGGVPDRAKERETQFWRQFLGGGIPDEVTRDAAWRFRDAFDQLEQTLQQSRFVAGDTLSVVDIAWCVYVNRLSLCGYPIESLHPTLCSWFEGLRALPAIADEITVPAEMLASFRRHQAALAEQGRDLTRVVAQ